MLLFVVISLLLLALYSVFLVHLIVNTAFYKGTKIVRAQNDAPGISIVIPFKNEAPHLPALLDSLVGQDYSGQFEVLLINDGSTDDYAKILQPYLACQIRPIKILTSCYNETIRLTSKQQALEKGVAQASHEWLIFTDADMMFQKNWLASMARMVPFGYDMVFGHTVLQKNGRSLFDAIQSFQLEFLFAVAYAFQVSKITGSCMGNNLLINKKSYNAINGQLGIGYSIVEDCALLEAFKHRGYSVAAVTPFVPTAYTLPCRNVAGFYRQILRWGRGGLKVKSGLFPLWLLFCFQNIFFLLSLLFPVPKPLLIASFANVLLTVFFIYCAFKKIGSIENVLFLPVYYVFLMFETMTFLFSFLVTPAVFWKGRRI